jgi:alpha-beta hydrolase superfamily lysophospholipase
VLGRFVYILAESGTSRLEEPEELRTFKVVARMAAGDYAALARALRGAGRVERDFAWIYDSWIRSHGRSVGAGWTENWRGVVEYATSRGWYNNSDGSIRAHVEWVETAVG